jgi:hypothetical protein
MCYREVFFMGSKWKPVQSTEIKDVKIVRDVIAQIRKPIPPEVYARIEARNRKLRRAWEPLETEKADHE